MSQRFLILTLLVVTGVSNPADAQHRSLPVEWDRATAAAAIDSVNIDPLLEQFDDHVLLEDAGSTIEKLTLLENRDDWPLPAREAAIYRFTRSLADLPADAVAPGILQHLKNYDARTMVPHEDHAGGWVPLFNIRGAAAGVENTWLRREVSYEAQRLLADDPESLVRTFSPATRGSINNIQRQALTDVLQNASFQEVAAVQDIVLEELPGSPGLTYLAGVTARITRDQSAIEALLKHGGGVGLTANLEAIGEQLPPGQLLELLEFATRHAPATNTSLAIAAWAPGLRGNTGFRDYLLDELSSDALGASAALALSRQLDVQTISILQAMTSGRSDAARRARMALDLGQSSLAGQP
jgi:hypothetical protein